MTHLNSVRLSKLKLVSIFLPNWIPKEEEISEILNDPFEFGSAKFVKICSAHHQLIGVFRLDLYPGCHLFTNDK
jgi:hypothetical protein